MRAFVVGAIRVSSEIAITEVLRTLRRNEPHPVVGVAAGVIRAETLLEELTLHPVEPRGLRRAGIRFDPQLRSLDAIHLGSALDHPPVNVFVTYDELQAAAAREAGLPVRSPGRENLGR